MQQSVLVFAMPDLQFSRAHQIVWALSTELWHGQDCARRLRQLESIESVGGIVPITGPFGGSIFSYGIVVVPPSGLVRDSFLQYVGFFLRRGASPFCLLAEPNTRTAVLHRYRREIMHALRRRIRHVLRLLLHSAVSPFRRVGVLVLQMVLGAAVPYAVQVLGSFDFDCTVQRAAVEWCGVRAEKGREGSNGGKRIQ